MPSSYIYPNSTTYMRKLSVRKKAEVMLAYANGKDIECRTKWKYALDPIWNWSTMDYHIKEAYQEENKLRTVVCVADRFGMLVPKVVYTNMELYAKSLDDNYPEYAPHTLAEFIEKV